MARFDVNATLVTIGELTGNGTDRDLFVHRVLEELLNAGFSRARFWEITRDISRDAIEDQSVAILTDQCPVDSSGLEIGHLRPLEESDVRTQPEGLLQPVVVGIPKELDAFEKAVEMRGRSRVTVPVTAGAVVDSLLACDWEGPKSELDESARAALRLIGAQIGSFLALNPSRTPDPTELGESSAEPPEVEKRVIDAAKQVATRIDAAATAIFRFDWPGQRLTKIKTLVAEPLQEKFAEIGDFKEVYRAGSDPLTGKAWANDEYRHIVSVENVKAGHEVWLDDESLDWHSKLLGRLRSVLYIIVGGLEERYLLRFINRASRPELPFLREAKLAEAFVKDLQAEIDKAIALRRLSNLQEASMQNAANESPQEVLATVGRSLAQESVTDFVMCCHQVDAAHLSYQQGYGPLAGSVELGGPRRWIEDELYRDALQRPFGAVALDRYATASRSPLGHALAQLAPAVLCQPVAAGFTKGVLFVPLDARPPSRGGDAVALPDKMGYGTASLIHAHSSLLANAVETEVSRERVQGALRSYGLLGHEVRRPVAAIHSATRRIVSANKAALSLLPDGSERDELEARTKEGRKNLRTAERRLASALQLAGLVARESEGRLRLRFDDEDLSQVVRRALDDVNLQIRDDDPLPWSTFIDLRPSARDLGSLVCDSYYVERVVANLLTNAVKYSVPRRRSPGSRDSTRILVIGGQQDDFISVTVRNWGWPVPEHMEEAIYEPWVRAYAEGEDAAISGMGLGLHLARRLLTAHEGEISFACTRTDDVFIPRMTEQQRRVNARARPLTEPVAIYQTDFEIRIPLNLRPGVHDHVWDTDEPEGAR